jgi:hypothetical protein
MNLSYTEDNSYENLQPNSIDDLKPVAVILLPRYEVQGRSADMAVMIDGTAFATEHQCFLVRLSN